jgi:alkylation response protein AidB-like acyl-CoA dehydrogenase
VTSPDWVAVARELGPAFALRAPVHDVEDSFVAENYDDLKRLRVFSAGVPLELCGGGATYSQLCAVLRELGRYCGSTALALAMHTHRWPPACGATGRDSRSRRCSDTWPPSNWCW